MPTPSKNPVSTLANKIKRIPFFFLDAGYPLVAKILLRCMGYVGRVPEKMRMHYFIRNIIQLNAASRKSRRKWRKLGDPWDYRIHLINRDRDAERLRSFHRRASKLRIPYTRISAFDCTDSAFDFAPYDSKIGESFNNTELFLKGAIGCFLSHVQAWKTFYESGELLGLICEDDALILGDLPPSARSYLFPENADLIFANSRMAEGLLRHAYIGKLYDSDFITIPLPEALDELMKIHPEISGPGGDGYFLTRKGVQKLLRLYDESKIIMDVDWFLVFLGLSREEWLRFLKTDSTDRFSSYEVTDRILEAHVLLPSLVSQKNIVSTIRSTPLYYKRRELFAVNPHLKQNHS